MESRAWTFLLFGALGVPLIGRLLVEALTLVGITAATPKYVAFFVLPGFLLLSDLASYLVGFRTRNIVMKRGAEQGLLTVIGFLAVVGYLYWTNRLESLAGLK
jgi:hypothetical protein